ncbi:hypothetical protein LEP1GSC196_2035 [Leptospira meyeri serovar Semaranga str. Veldrot Semarang 173]|nr:hypothetical protein LEP1GSC196_2035 [Leptospira meyeri serovar Semaranga str. Veldrot Semarang 173]
MNVRRLKNIRITKKIEWLYFVNRSVHCLSFLILDTKKNIVIRFP